ncbi:hypothetical protein [Abyssisolibacter fermentans]|uniref:hypothetical protein n=1 Tax=Abyssisolibacter fermentans TaxID=1766203 RepID=UPI0012E3ADBE|nr:hypothetical protein [Abyssisolibacter fermentans]
MKKIFLIVFLIIVMTIAYYQIPQRMTDKASDIKFDRIVINQMVLDKNGAFCNSAITINDKAKIDELYNFLFTRKYKRVWYKDYLKYSGKTYMIFFSKSNQLEISVEILGDMYIQIIFNEELNKKRYSKTYRLDKDFDTKYIEKMFE